MSMKHETETREETTMTTMRTIRLELSEPDAKALLKLLKTSDTFPDVVEELEGRLAVREALHNYGTRREE